MFLTFAKKLGQPIVKALEATDKDNKLGSTLGSSLGKNMKGVNKGLGVSPKNHSRQPSLFVDGPEDAPAEIIKFDLAVVDNLFDKFYKTEESLSGFLNIKVIKQKFTDFRKKIDVWKKGGTVRQRNRNKKNFTKNSSALIASFKKAKGDFTYDN